MSAGKKFKNLVKENKPLAIVGVINAYSALQASRIGHKALYLSGSGVASASYGLADLGIIGLEEVCIDVRRISSRVDTPLLVDADTGFGGAFNIARTVKELSRAGVAAMHIEDQVSQKRCGHRPNKELVSIQEMCDRIKAALDAKLDPDFVIMARTDAYSIEGLDRAIERSLAYVEAGAEMLFAEAVSKLEDYEAFSKSVKVPVLANITEFGKTPYFSQEELKKAGIAMVLYPLSANRAMNKAAFEVYTSILKHGHQREVLKLMETREELYEMLDYYAYEQKLDALFKKGKK
ncbi:methylisocitrate lyase [Helicobacter suis]|uniref:2-methylisocitrate lyase n=1 Tax=Helicobacter suis TaxID=104628 RepID=A0ABM7KZW1_9HELI|nr:methylisocitrate lyase [Helicobacter suis]BCD45976.1 2-methylisocitrate lyase [Helicobacter suis]BCD51620.1 2-methylisocitrate lyase [Helicobacter suis]BDR28049.1 2-methylisocitrate lyase [Helicobacter suis HS1]GFK16988.1 2-methylisocitrate lyase [Helicobacter suis]